MANVPADFDVGIVGGGPAGLSAAIFLGRACRRVVLFDHGRPRNAAARAVHGFMGLDGCSPTELRAVGRREAQTYGVQIIDDPVAAALGPDNSSDNFRLRLTSGESLAVRKLLLATGVVDELPDVEHIADFYGRTVHHCPYCDGWEHRDQRLIALARGKSIAELATTLLGWSRHVTACTDGAPLSRSQREALAELKIEVRTEKLTRMIGEGGVLHAIEFVAGPPLQCSAIFFGAGQSQASRLFEALGCKSTDEGLIATTRKQSSDCAGLFVAGDAGSDVQFAIVAAAQGAIAATAINKELIAEMHQCKKASAANSRLNVD